MPAQSAVSGWKRGLLLRQPDGRVLVAGAFVQAGVPAVASTRCDNPQAHGAGPVPDPERGCWCGFNAFTDRMHALRYDDPTRPLFGVELSGRVYPTGAGDRIRVGERQRVTRVETARWCGTCPDLTPLTGLASPPSTDPAHDEVELRPLCPAHAGTVSVSFAALSDLLGGVPVTPMTADLARWARARSARRDPWPARCACDRVERVTESFGLRYYLGLWSPVGPQVDGVLPMRCRACGAEWSYQRGRLPVHAVRVSLPNHQR